MHRHAFTIKTNFPLFAFSCLPLVIVDHKYIHMDSNKPIIIMGNFINPSSSSCSRPLLLFLAFLAILLLQFSSKSVFPIRFVSGPSRPGDDDVSVDPRSCAGFFGHVGLPRRKVAMSIAEFGGVGDGKTSNTETFRKAVRYMQGFGHKGGSQLNVPKGMWVTGSFNLTSNFTLFLEEGAVILGSQASKYYSI